MYHEDVTIHVDCKDIVEILAKQFDWHDELENANDLRKFIKNIPKFTKFCEETKYGINEMIYNLVQIYPSAFSWHLIKFIKKNYKLDKTFL